MSKLIDENILKAAVENAYNIAYKEGVMEGKLLTLKTLRQSAEQVNIKHIPVQTIIELIESLNKND